MENLPVIIAEVSVAHSGELFRNTFFFCACFRRFTVGSIKTRQITLWAVGLITTNHDMRPIRLTIQLWYSILYGVRIGSFVVGEESTQSLPFAKHHVRWCMGMWLSNGLHHVWCEGEHCHSVSEECVCVYSVAVLDWRNTICWGVGGVVLDNYRWTGTISRKIHIYVLHVCGTFMTCRIIRQVINVPHTCNT